MKSILKTALLAVSCLLFINSTTFAGETEDLKKEITDLKQIMQQMQKRLDVLEQRNKELEEKSVATETKMQDAYSTTTTARKSPMDGGFIQRAIQTLNPDISAIGIFSASYFSEDEPLAGAEVDPEDTGVDLQEIELAFSGSIDPYFRFDTYFVIDREGIETEEAFATTLGSLPLNSQYRVGIMRSKFGRINTLHRHSQNFVTLPLVANAFLGEHLNPTAIEANFLVPVPWFFELSAAVGSPEVETASFDRDGDKNNLGRLLYMFHIKNFFEVSESLSLNLGGSFATGANGVSEGSRTNLYGADLFVKYRPISSDPYKELMLQSEFMYRDADGEEGSLSDHGFYTQLIYRFAKRWNAGARFGMTDTDDPLEFEEEDEDHEAELLADNEFFNLINSGEEEEHHEGELGLFGETYRVSAMLTFNPSEFSRIRLQYDYTDPDFTSDQHALFLQFQYSLGAHGAHPF
ncbi:MAG: hypothetical protein GWM89_00630 [Candidatus Dadabacteria bacterium]|nr:hypothetical protein [Candidatus Dadabacteria bacterium]NIX14452.1 hypothetical protein [Candidatus Dadabacteria bacterium]NIY20940.1 hypothetical protein [Candidatus Dadabacteria bacterium]